MERRSECWLVDHTKTPEPSQGSGGYSVVVGYDVEVGGVGCVVDDVAYGAPGPPGCAGNAPLTWSGMRWVRSVCIESA